MKIAKILVGDPTNKKGMFNNILERTKHLMLVEPDVDCYMIRIEYGFILGFLKKKTPKCKREEFTLVDGVKFKNLWLKMDFFSYLITHYLHKRIVICPKKLKQYSNLFKNYDLLSTHGIEAHYLSVLVKEKYQIPFVATWHGSDINITPFHTIQTKCEVKKILDMADHNFFVSEKLMKISDKISKDASKGVLYTGPAKNFYRFSNEKIKQLRDKYQIKTTYIVGFIGNIVEIKNVLILPALFKEIQKRLNNDVSFIVVGDGNLDSKLEQKFCEQQINNLYLMGKKEPEEVPDIMNSLDLLVLPSLNEGLPRVTLEAQACGVCVVGSNRGGIPEAIGSENCFELDGNFVHNVANRTIELLSGKRDILQLPEKFSWDTAIKKELSVYHSLNNIF
ncbi:MULTISPECIES: glycosyltransferase family 4 protein [unclassified Acinetobacter]|uniref:glycosyltransferase family 4 protein n=1 Tax=unclassified Acinetobacter TaxID=196816 RepID=UPI0015D35E46|nr:MULTISPECIES: glycosyltransferase family 4 protein [unclassified Acinetobacter]